MTGIEEAIVVGAILGSATAATGIAAWVGQRLHTKLDRINDTLSGEHGHTARLAVIESRLPNGEWREIKNSVSRVEETVNEMKEEQIRVRDELHTHIADEESRIVSAVDRLREAGAT